MKYFYLSLLIVLCCLVFAACDLFSGPANPNYLDDLYEELAWSRAEKLEVNIAIPFSWGESNPDRGPIRADIRMGEGERYSFPVEFMPNSGFGFRGWLAFTNEKYAEISSSLNEMSFKTAHDDHSLNGKGVTITPHIPTHTRGFVSTVTINISDKETGGIILVPFCDTRPQVSRSNPPQPPAISPFAYDQRITLWFNIEIDIDTVII